MIPNLLTLLNNTKLQSENIALYNVLKNIINNQDELDKVKIAFSDIVTQVNGFPISDVSGAGLLISANVLSAVKIANLVVASINIVYPATASGLAAVISGLPFVSERTLVSAHSCAIGFQNANLNMQAFIISGTQQIAFVLATGVQVTNAQLTGANIALTAIYKVLEV